MKRLHPAIGALILLFAAGLILRQWNRNGILFSNGLGTVRVPMPGTAALRRGVQPASGSAQEPLSTEPKALLASIGAALELIHAEQDLSERERQLESLAHGVAPGDRLAALDWLAANQSSSASIRGMIGKLVRTWAEDNPVAAAEWAAQHLDTADRREALRGIASLFAGRNLQEAVEWSGRFPAEADRIDTLTSIAYEMAGREPLEALKLAVTLPAGNSRDELVTQATRQWTGTTPRAAIDWAAQISDQQLRDKVLSGVATAWAESDPGSAAALAVNSINPGKAQDDAVVGVVQRWAQTNPEQAAAWVEEFPAGVLRDTALEQLAKLWFERDPARAEAWAASLPPGDSRDLAMGTFVERLAVSLPEKAAALAMEIEDDATRLRHLENLGEIWMAGNEAQARQWILQSSLPQQTKNRLLMPKRPSDLP